MPSLTSSFDWLHEELVALKDQGLFRNIRTFESIDAVSAYLNGKKVTLFSSNDYLGLSRHPQLIEAAKKAIDQYGVGAQAARLVSGTSNLHTQLEERIAQFEEKEKALVFSSGYLANLGTISALAQKEDLLILDKLNHASIIDASKLSEATVRVYPHKNLEYLERILKTSSAYKKVWIVTDSMFSMDGDLAPLKELAELKQRYGAYLIVDEAHGTGVFGAKGRGVAEHLEVDSHIDVHIGTLSKAVGTLGGFVAAKAELIEYLINRARSFIFATALPASVCAAAIAAFDLIEKEPSLRQKLWHNMAFLKEEMKQLGIDFVGTLSPISPILIGDEKETLQLADAILAQGYFVPPIRYPTVGKGKARLRLTLSASHSEAQIHGFVQALYHAVRYRNP